MNWHAYRRRLRDLKRDHELIQADRPRNHGREPLHHLKYLQSPDYRRLTTKRIRRLLSHEGLETLEVRHSYNVATNTYICCGLEAWPLTIIRIVDRLQAEGVDLSELFISDEIPAAPGLPAGLRQAIISEALALLKEESSGGADKPKAAGLRAPPP